jgi:hypothetical protein
MSQFPNNSGGSINGKKASEEESKYKSKYPEARLSYDFDVDQLIKYGEEAAKKGATQYYFINGLDSKGNTTLNYGFIDEAGKWVVKPGKLALKQAKSFKKAHPTETRAYGWGTASLTPWLIKKQAAGADIVSCCNGVDDNGNNTLLVRADQTLSLSRSTTTEDDEDAAFNIATLCPPLCGGGED